MPNIEIHGMERGTAEAFRFRIFHAIGDKNLELAAETVVTIVLDECVNFRLKVQPFLRIIVTKIDPLEELLEYLKSVAIDKEILTIGKYIPGCRRFR